MELSREALKRVGITGAVVVVAFYVLFTLGVVWGVLDTKNVLLMKWVTSFNLTVGAACAAVFCVVKFPGAWEQVSDEWEAKAISHKIVCFSQRMIYTCIPLSLILGLAIVWGAVSDEQIITKSILTMVVLVLSAVGIETGIKKYETTRTDALVPATPEENKMRSKILAGVVLGLLLTVAIGAGLANYQQQSKESPPSSTSMRNADDLSDIIKRRERAEGKK
jgi:hypothetical protein